MSEEIKIKNILNSQKNIKINFPKFFVKLKNNLNDNNSELQKYLIKSRNAKPMKRQNFTPFSLNKINITKSTFYSKKESNSSTKYDNNKNYKIKYNLTELNQTYTNKLNNNKNNRIVLSTLFKMPDYKRKTINYFKRPKNNSLSLKTMTNNIKFNDIQNISNIKYPKLKEEKKNNTILSSSNHLDSQITDKTNTINNITHITNNNNSKSKEKYDHFSNLAFYLKDRFYSDIEEKFKKQFKEKKFSHDNSVKDKIIGLNQVSEFWGRVFDYTNPFLCTKRFQSVTKLIEDRKKIRKMKMNNNNNNVYGFLSNGQYFNLPEKKNKNRKMPKIYTVSNLIQKRKKEIKKEKLVEEMKKNKTEEQMRIFLNNLYE